MIFRNTLTCAFAIACSMSATIPAWGQQEAERQVQVDAAIGQTMRLRGHVNYSHGCSDVIPTDITVIQAPLYGTLTIKNEVVHAKDAELGRGCVGSSGMGKVVYYTRAHEGTDSFSYDSASSNGVVHVYVTVRSARTSGPAAAEPSTAQPALPTPAQLIAGEPMHIALVRAQGPGCDPNCPTWITASGKIVPRTAEKLRQVIQSLAGRRLPILVSSPGGFVAEAMAMGRLIRRSGFSVAVADTSLAVCQPVGKSCEDQRASTSFGAICESACSLVLAGGVRRYVSGYSVVGVHELMALRTVTRTLRRYEILYQVVGGRKLEVSRRLVSEESSSHSTVSEAGEDLERSAADYFAEMGVGEPVVRLTALTPSTSIRRLTMGELREFSPRDPRPWRSVSYPRRTRIQRPQSDQHRRRGDRGPSGRGSAASYARRRTCRGAEHTNQVPPRGRQRASRSEGSPPGQQGGCRSGKERRAPHRRARRAGIRRASP